MGGGSPNDQEVQNLPVAAQALPQGEPRSSPVEAALPERACIHRGQRGTEERASRSPGAPDHEPAPGAARPECPRGARGVPARPEAGAGLMTVMDSKWRYGVRYRSDSHLKYGAYFALFTNTIDLGIYWDALGATDGMDQDRLTVDWFDPDGTIWNRNRTERLK